ncbi:MAG: MraZ protein, partial [Rhodospirillaceae bacterium]
MALFIGTFVNKIDRKGLVSVPATFRAALTMPGFAGLGFAGMVGFRSFVGPCLEAGGLDWMERLSEGVDDLAVFSIEQDELVSLIFADARQMSFDPEGRIVLAEDLMAHVDLTETAAFVGKGKTFQIWKPEVFKKMHDEMRDRVLKN